MVRLLILIMGSGISQNAKDRILEGESMEDTLETPMEK